MRTLTAGAPFTSTLPPAQPNLLQLLRENYGCETTVFGINHAWETLFSTHEAGAGISDYHSFTRQYHEMALAACQARTPLDLDNLIYTMAAESKASAISLPMTPTPLRRLTT